MPRIRAAAVLMLSVCAFANDTAQLNDKGELRYPGDYREWIFLSSGLGMTYGPNAPAPGTRLRFDNVYVNPSSYRSFKQTGKWPQGTIFVLEIRESEQKGSINQHGHFQGRLVGLEANVKDSVRFPGDRVGLFRPPHSRRSSVPTGQGTRARQRMPEVPFSQWGGGRNVCAVLSRTGLISLI